MLANAKGQIYAKNDDYGELMIMEIMNDCGRMSPISKTIKVKELLPHNGVAAEH